PEIGGRPGVWSVLEGGSWAPTPSWREELRARRWRSWWVLRGDAVASAAGSARTSWWVRARRAPPLLDTDNTIALWQAPGVLTPVYRFCKVAVLTPAGTQPLASLELLLM